MSERPEVQRGQAGQAMTLVGQFRQIIAELELLSYGSTANWSTTDQSRGSS
jgi:hypothetical protein